MPAYLVGIYRHPSREAAERADTMCAPDFECEHGDTEIHDTPPVVLSGLVRGGEIRNDEDWWSVWPVAGTYVLTDSSGRFVPCTLAAVRAALPVTWYRYEEP